LEEGRKKLQREAGALKERLASDPDVITILVEARKTLVQDCKSFLANPNPRDETWKMEGLCFPPAHACGHMVKSGESNHGGSGRAAYKGEG
jgi:hypothetical protein